jgi:type I restriction enzyme S subunit
MRLQKAIAEVLGALDDKIAANRRAIDLGKEMLVAQWRLLTDNAAEVMTLDRIVEVSPKVPTSKEAVPLYLDMKNLPEFGLLVDDWARREPKGGARFQNGDTLLARITPCFENGKIAWVDFLDKDECGYGSTEYIVLRSRPGVPSIVSYLIASSSEFRSFAERHRTGTSGRQRVQARELASFHVQMPESHELASFGNSAEALLRRLGAARTENRALGAARDELLPLLMSGKISVKDAEGRIDDATAL